MMNKSIETSDKNLLPIYNRFPIALEHGEGMYLYDENGKKYLDFGAGFAVSALGYGNKKLAEALKEQIDLLYHTSNLYYHKNCAEAAEKLNQYAKMDKIFFTNSGAEAIEGALKTARRYAYNKKSGKYEFIAMENSFHGRTFGALSVTGHEAYRTPFEPLVPGVSFAEFNNIESVKKLVTEKTCAIILEPIQGEGGIHPATQEFMEEIRKLCDEKDILLIFDEVQCGMGRSGSMFAWQGYGVKPDILAMAKGIGSGIPVGAFGMVKKVAENSLKQGDHGATYGGNPLACKAVKTVLDIFEEENMLGHVKEITPYLEAKLDSLAEKMDCIMERRGKGLIQGIVLKQPVSEVCTKAMEEGLLVIQAQGNVLRLVPPLIVGKEHIDEMIEKLKKALS